MRPQPCSIRSCSALACQLALVLVTVGLAEACKDAPGRSHQDEDGPVIDARQVPAAPPTHLVDAVLSNSIELADANDDGTEDFFVLCSDAGVYEGDVDLCGFDGRKFEGLWRVGPIGPQSLAYTMQIERVGRSVIAIAPNGRVVVLDISTGTLTSQLKLPGRADLACAPDDSTLWVRLHNETGRVAMSTGAYVADTSATPEPRCACLEAGEQAGWPCRQGKLMDPTRGANGLSWMPRAMAGDATIMMVIDRSPRSLVSLPSDGGAPLWSLPVAPGDPLMVPDTGTDALTVAAGRAFTSYDDANHQPHLVALDANTGTRLWDVETESGVRLSASAERVYVHRWGRVEVRDAASGSLLGGIGTGKAGVRSAVAPARREVL